MKRLSNVLFSIAAAAALTTGFGIAQAAEPINAVIPFDFTVGKTKMPAGHYSIETNKASRFVVIRDVANRRSAIVLWNADVPSQRQESYLTFRVHGSKHYLAGAQSSALGVAWDLAMTSAEREAMLAAGNQTQTLFLALK